MYYFFVYTFYFIANIFGISILPTTIRVNGVYFVNSIYYNGTEWSIKYFTYISRIKRWTPIHIQKKSKYFAYLVALIELIKFHYTDLSI